MIYAAIVLTLIVGFYAIAFIDRAVREKIFSQQSGIQFITLFSLVIAIILFGVLGVLEGKELSALLGGISGYILGRVTAERLDVGNGSGLKSKIVSSSGIAFSSPNSISDLSGVLGVFSVGDRVIVSGSTRNDGAYTVSSVTSGAMVTREMTIQNEAAGASIRIST